MDHRMKTLLESYYGVSENDENQGKETDLDSMGFRPESYVEDKLKKASFAELLKTDDDLVQEIRTFDADMQLLVYDNYSKFISATDTIRSMKTNVNEIEGEIEALVEKVENIHQSALSINERTAPRRKEIEKLVRLQSLLRKLNFLFELPLRLNQCIEMDALSQAVFYFNRAIPILQKHSEVASFASIERESRQVMSNLRTRLETAVTENNQSFDKFNERIKLLVELKGDDEDLQSLSTLFLDWHKNYFEDRITVVDKSRISLEEFIEQMCSTVLDTLSATCVSFRELFCQGDDADEKNELLVAFAEPILMVTFLNAIHTRLVDDDVSLWRNSISSDADGEEDDERNNYRPLLNALNVLISRIKTFRVDRITKKGVLSDRTTEIAEHVVRKQVVLAFDMLRERVGRLLSYEDEKHGDESPVVVAELIGKEIEKDIAHAMDELNRLLDESADLLAELASIFDNLVRFQLRYWFLWLASALECVCDPYHPSRKGGNEDPLAVPTVQLSAEREKIFVDLPVRNPVTAQYILTLTSLAQHMRNYVRGQPFSVTGAPELMNEFDSSKNKLLVLYVEIRAKEISSSMRKEIENKGQFLSGIAPSGVRQYAIDIVQSIVAIVKQVGQCTKEKNPMNRANSSSSISSGSPNPTSRFGQRNSFRNTNIVGSDGVDMDIERMFAQKLKIVDKVMFTSDAICIGVLKIVLKTFFECVRMHTISKYGFQQLEVDICFLRSVIALVIVDDNSIINSLLAQILSASRDRCLDPEQLNQDTLDRFCHTTRESLRLNLR